MRSVHDGHLASLAVVARPAVTAVAVSAGSRPTGGGYQPDFPTVSLHDGVATTVLPRGTEPLAVLVEAIGRDPDGRHRPPRLTSGIR